MMNGEKALCKAGRAGARSVEIGTLQPLNAAKCMKFGPDRTV
jgi:hypothetical protein